MARGDGSLIDQGLADPSKGYPAQPWPKEQPAAQPPAAPAGNHMPAPSSGHKGGGGGSDGGLNQFQSMFEEMMSRYDKLLDAYLNPQTPEGPQPGLGFEDTILSRRVLDEDKIRRPGLIPMYGGTPGAGSPQRQVVDPVTGAIYPSPEAALQAGVTTWKYVPVPAVA